MQTIRVVIADAEPLYRERVAAALACERDVAVAGTASDGHEAIEMIRSLRPHVVILATEMPGLSGLEVAARCGAEPLIIFVSRHAKHAVNAFDMRALDYILKPFKQGRLRESLGRARARLRTGLVDAARESLLDLSRRNGPTEPSNLGQVVVKSAGRVHFIAVRDIEWIESVGNYLKLHTALESHVMRETMSNTITRLGPSGFAQVHRSKAVNIHRILHITPSSHGAHTIVLESGACVPLSKTYRASLENFLRRTFAALGAAPPTSRDRVSPLLPHTRLSVDLML